MCGDHVEGESEAATTVVLEGKGQHLAAEANHSMALGHWHGPAFRLGDSTRLSSPDINHRIHTTCSRHMSNTGRLRPKPYSPS